MPTASIVKGRGYLNHNDRTIKQVNSRSWKPELSSQNIVYVNEPIQNVYHDLFDTALENYNQSQIKKKSSRTSNQRLLRTYQPIQTGEAILRIYRGIWQYKR